jgi:glycyl-tRNA synthetase beta chain
MPFFIAVNNTAARDPELVAKGNERVLRARLSDARFFFDADLKIPLDQWLEQLHGVLFQAKLGTMYDKVMRVEKLSVYLADLLNVDEEFKKLTATAARLCKIDLVSQVVGEFPKLQGVMGRIYAAESGKPEPVSTAIEEHYRPTYSGGPLPESTAGAIVGIADKMDSICGCFRAGLLPTGASDPYALRRQGIGIVQIILDRGFSLPLTAVIEASLGFFEENREPQKQEIAGKVYAFLENRIVQMMVDEGYPKDIIAAVSSVSVDDIPAVWSRVRALTSLRSAPDFEPLAIAFKRVVNIIKQAGPPTVDDMGALDEGLFQHDCESRLFRAFHEVEENVKRDLETGAFDQALRDIASLRPLVDAFFDGVMVMAEDDRLRNNRLALLGKVASLFETYADFSRIST